MNGERVQQCTLYTNMLDHYTLDTVTSWVAHGPGFSQVHPFSQCLLAFWPKWPILHKLDCTHVNDLNWENLYRAVVCHLANLPPETAVITPQTRPHEMCRLQRWAGRTGWQTPEACDHLWHPEFLQILLQDTPTWVWVPRLIICRPHQRALGMSARRNQGQLTCTDPNCTRAHAPDWHRAELYAFHWLRLVKHNRISGLGVGFALDGSLLDISHTRAKRILADMPYMDPLVQTDPAPRAYGDMIVTATSRRANLNEQPRKRDTTPRRTTTPRRSSSRVRYGSPRPSSRQPEENPPWIPPTKAPPVPPPPQQKYDESNDPWAAPIPGTDQPVPILPAAKLLLLNYQPR